MAFPIIVTIITGVTALKGLLMGMIMLGNFRKVTGSVTRLCKASENEIANIATLLPRPRHRRHGMAGHQSSNSKPFSSSARPRRHHHRHRRWPPRQDLHKLSGGKVNSPSGRWHLCLPDGRPPGPKRRPTLEQTKLPHARHGRQHRRTSRLRHGRRHHALSLERSGHHLTSA
ncbi:MAG: hypothetical protein IPP19_15910 [Verrucomicrobia bacterium]|nr:hypothetical protein [Verrucomicrobiota bacterium]